MERFLRASCLWLLFSVKRFPRSRVTPRHIYDALYLLTSRETPISVQTLFHLLLIRTSALTHFPPLSSLRPRYRLWVACQMMLVVVTSDSSRILCIQ
jgi:hypothetical protein